MLLATTQLKFAISHMALQVTIACCIFELQKQQPKYLLPVTCCGFMVPFLEKLELNRIELGESTMNRWYNCRVTENGLR